MIRQYVTRNSIAMVGSAAGVAQGIVLIPLMINSVGVATYGTWVLLNTLLQFLYGISSLGAGVVKDRYIATTTDPAERRKLFYPQLVFHLGMIAILALPVWVIAVLLPESEADRFSTVLAFGNLLLLMLYNQSNQYLRYTNRIFTYTVQGTLQSTAQVFVIVYLATAGTLGIDALLGARIVVMAVATLPVGVFMFKELGGPIVWPVMRSVWNDIKVGFPLTVSYVLETILAVGDRYVLLAFLPRSTIGAYAAAYTLGSLPLLLPRSAGVVVPQMLFEAMDNGQDHKARAVLSLTFWLFALLVIPYCAGALMVGPDVLTVFAGADVAAEASTVVPIIAAGCLFYGTSMLVSQALFAKLQTKTMLGGSGIAALSNVLVNAAVLSFFPNILVPAFVTALSYGLMLRFMLNRLPDDARIQPAFGILARAALAAGLMGVMIHFTRKILPFEGMAALAVLIVGGVATYVGTLAVLRITRSHEWRAMREVLS